MPLGVTTGRVADMVRKMVPRFRYVLSDREQELAPYLRSNDALLAALTGIVMDRIQGRELSPIPTDPVDCKATMAMDRELRWLVQKLEYVHNAPLEAGNDTDSEQPG